MTGRVGSQETLREVCRFRDDEGGHLCGQPAEMIVWGKLFPPDALGPRCYDHAAEQIGHRVAGDRSPGLAIYHFAGLAVADPAGTPEEEASRG